MSDTNNAAMYGRPTKRKVKYGGPMATTANSAPVGPVDDPALIANAAVIIRSATPPPAAPAPRKERVMVDPDEHDFFVPKRARWAEIQKVATGVGA